MSSHAEKSNEMASAPTETKMLKWLKSVLQPGGTPFIPIAEAGHHIHVDQPIALTSVLRSLSSDGGYFYKKPSNLYNDAAILNPTVKTILITGAGSGIGRAWTKGFINDGYTVTAADINKNSLNSLMMELDSPYTTAILTPLRTAFITSRYVYILPNVERLGSNRHT